MPTERSRSKDARDSSKTKRSSSKPDDREEAKKKLENKKRPSFRDTKQTGDKKEKIRGSKEDKYSSGAGSKDDKYSSRSSLKDDKYSSRSSLKDDKYSSRSSLKEDKYSSRSSLKGDETNSSRPHAKDDKVTSRRGSIADLDIKKALKKSTRSSKDDKYLSPKRKDDQRSPVREEPIKKEAPKEELKEELPKVESEVEKPHHRRSAIPTPIHPASARAKMQVEELAQQQQEEVPEETVEVDYDYDDEDFEDYDDDFEEEEEDESAHHDHKMDSGNYERARRQIEMAEVKAAMERENSANNHHDSGHGSNDEQAAAVEAVKPKSGKIGFNFASAKQRQKSQVVAGKAKKRGFELLTMIRLDTVKIDLFEMPPIAYELLMNKSNRVQATCQTGEDDIDEELQTEPIVMKDKWTQNPPPPLTSLKDPDDQEMVMQYLHGVGGDELNVGYEKFLFKHESARLSRFLDSASQAIMILLDEDEERKYGSSRDAQEQKDVVFSEKVTLIDIDNVQCLVDRRVKAMSFAPDQSSLLVIGHGATESDFRSYITVWNVGSPSMPLHILVASNEVQVLTFSPSKASMVFAGMEDGSISVWDLRESYGVHREVVKIDESENDSIHRSPTYTTASDEAYHESPISGLKTLPPEETPGLGFGLGDDEVATTFQLVSSEEQGKVIIWTVLDSVRDINSHLGLAHWGCVRIVSSIQVDLPVESLTAHDVIFASRKIDNRGDLLVATGMGNIYHGSIHIDHKPSPRYYKPELECSTACRSLTFCPFGEQYFLAGSDDGSVRMHSLVSEKPLITWPGTVDGQPVTQVIWSPSRPCVFFILDSDSRIHLWDLGVGDIYPAHTVQFEERVNVISVNPDLGDPRQKQMLALGMEDGKVEVHHLKQDYQAVDAKSCSKELERFLHYVSII